MPGIEQSRWDLVVFDEAHKLSAYRYGPSAKIDKTKRYMLAEGLSARTKHLLLMTATPHKGDPENFVCCCRYWTTRCSALTLGSKRPWARMSRPISSVGRRSPCATTAAGRCSRPAEWIRWPMSLEPHEQALYDAVTDYGLAQAEQSQNRNVTLALIVLQRRLASSRYAATRSLERRRDRLADELDQSRKSGRLAHTAFQASYDPDEDDLDDLTAEDEEAIPRFPRCLTKPQCSRGCPSSG